MLNVTRHELDMLTVGTAATVVVFVFVSAAIAWWRDREMREIRATLAWQDEDIDQLWAWCIAAAAALGWTGEDDQDPGEDDDPSPDEPDQDPPGGEVDDPTVISHPADMWARKQSLLPRYTHIGQHRP